MIGYFLSYQVEKLRARRQQVADSGAKIFDRRLFGCIQGPSFVPLWLLLVGTQVVCGRRRWLTGNQVGASRPLAPSRSTGCVKGQGSKDRLLQ